MLGQSIMAEKDHVTGGDVRNAAVVGADAVALDVAADEIGRAHV